MRVAVQEVLQWLVQGGIVGLAAIIRLSWVKILNYTRPGGTVHLFAEEAGLDVERLLRPTFRSEPEREGLSEDQPLPDPAVPA
jgi:hypothetical protein